MKKLFAMLLALLMLICPALAEGNDLQAEANAAYARVLLDNAVFQPLEEYVRTQEEWKAVQFTVMDMDGDGVAEVIVEVMEPEGFILLTYQNGVVYGDELVYRALLSLKDDATFVYSSGAADNGVAELGFTVNDDTGEITGIDFYSLAEAYTDENGDIHYCRDGGTQEMDEAGYTAFCEEQDRKLDAIWYDFTEENIRMLLNQ